MIKLVSKKIIGILITLVVLYFASMSLYESVFYQLEAENPPIDLQIESGEQDFQNPNPQEKPEPSDESGNQVTDDNNSGLSGNNVESTEVEENALDGSTTVEKEKINIKLYANAAALMDADTGRVLYEKNGNKQLPMASTTKIMTCIVTLENANLDDVVTISQYASTMPDVQLNVRKGEQFKLKDLLYSLMLESHNDVAVAIAEHVGGSIEGFAEMMNQKAKELGCENTNFVTPNGLDANGHYTTAVELAKIASYAIKNKDFIDITNTASWQFNELKKGQGFNVSNKDRFLYMYDGAIGVKTGFTSKAGYCFVGAVKKNGKTFVSSVIQSGWPPHRNYKWSDTTNLMDHGMKNFEPKQIFNADKEFNPVYVDDGKERYVELYYEGDLTLLMSDYDEVTIEYKVPKAIMAPVTAESIVGSAKYYINGELYQEFPIYTAGSVDKIDFKFCFDKIKKIWMTK
jgi:D-alanyl-D-alanine carboxypeptidase (penicillin-binding protein 5/6)